MRLLLYPFLLLLLPIVVLGQDLGALNQRAASGDSQAMYELGVHYRNGNGVAKDKFASFKWFWNAANQGHPDAQYTVGYHYVIGDVVDKSAAEGGKWVMKAAQQGHAYAANALATMYGRGMGLIQSQSESAKWLQSAAAGGHTGAMVQLAAMYEKGDVILRDFVRAYAWNQVASLLGDSTALAKRDQVAKYLDEPSLLRAKDFSLKAMQLLGSKAAPVPAIHDGGRILQSTDVRNMVIVLPPLAPSDGSPLPPPLASVTAPPAPPATITAPKPVVKTIAPKTLTGPTTLAPPAIRLVSPMVMGGRNFNIPKLELQMVWVSPGTFIMGDSTPVAQGLLDKPGRLPDRAGPGGGQLKGGPGKGGQGKRPGGPPGKGKGKSKGQGKPGNIFGVPDQVQGDDPLDQDMDDPRDAPGKGGGSKLRGAEPHEVKITQGYWLGKFEITNEQYSMLTGMEAEGGRDWPVVNLSWQDAENFCVQLNKSFGASSRIPQGWAFQLPTEAQWEYACRAGTTSSFSFGDDLDAGMANINASGAKRSGSSLRTVGSYPANPWGFHDMHGNAMEYVHDWYGPYPVDVQGLANPSGPTEGTEKLARGGSWKSRPQSSQSFSRNRVSGKEAADETCGFRVCLAPKLVQVTTQTPNP